MSNKLLWKMFTLIAVGTVILFWSIDVLNRQAENQMSYIGKKYQQQITAYGQEAERLFLLDEPQKLAQWITNLQVEERTWAAIVKSSINLVANSSIPEGFANEHRLGRSVQWKIHLYFKENPVMEVTFADKDHRFLIQLPQRMRPGGYYPIVQLLLQIALPFIILSVLSLMLYQHVMKPVSALKKATQQFSDGDYDIQLKSSLGTREDELTVLADSFDQMVNRTGKLIINQRQLLENLSHELRTPLARLDMALECIKQGIQTDDSFNRLSNESAMMRELIEDTLMLVWLNNETPHLNKDSFDLVDLLEVICSDARFEYPQHDIKLLAPEQLLIEKSSQRALSQAIENIVRNALQHTPVQQQVTVEIVPMNAECQIVIKDRGPGVPNHLLEDIFQPFFQVDTSRSRKKSVIPIANGVRRGGFGLGLALAQRQIFATGGSLIARNTLSDSTHSVSGLNMTITLPYSCHF